MATLAQGFIRVCEVIGLDQIGDIIPGKQSFVQVESLRQRFQLNMSKPQAKKIMILAIRTAHSGEIETTGSAQIAEGAPDKDNIPPEKIILI